MNYPIGLPCHGCGEIQTVYVDAREIHPEWTCECGFKNAASLPGDFGIGEKILNLSINHLEKNDYVLSIIFSATAFEWQLSDLFRKWLQIRKYKERIHLEPQDVEQELFKYTNIRKKINKVARLMNDDGLEGFVQTSDDWKDLTERFPSLRITSLAEGFQRAVFWPRNRILHMGFTDITKEDAERCCSIANIGVKLLQAMDLTGSEKFLKELSG